MKIVYTQKTGLAEAKPASKSDCYILFMKSD